MYRLNPPLIGPGAGIEIWTDIFIVTDKSGKRINISFSQLVLESLKLCVLYHIEIYLIVQHYLLIN
jgi:hypothetical protein